MGEDKRTGTLFNGDANAINNLTNTTNNVTYVGRAAEEVLLNECKAQYRKKCESLIEDGVISKNVRLELNVYAESLGLDDSVCREIEDGVKRTKCVATSLSGVQKIMLDDVIEQIENNKAGSQNLGKLEAMAQVDDEKVQFYYHLLLVSENASEYIKKFEKRDADSYWDSFWAYVAYKKNGADTKAEQQLMELDKFAAYPAANILVLNCAGWLFPSVGGIGREQINSAKRTFNRCCNAPVSDLLRPFMTALENLIDQDTNVRQLSGEPQIDFYLGRIFSVKPVQKPVQKPAPMSYAATSAPRVSDDVVDTIDTMAKNWNSMNAASVAGGTTAATQTRQTKTVTPTDLVSRKKKSDGMSSTTKTVVIALAIAGVLLVFFVLKPIFFSDKADVRPSTVSESSLTTSGSNAKTTTAPATKPASKPAAKPASKPAAAKSTTKPANTSMSTGSNSSSDSYSATPAVPKQKSVAEMSPSEAYNAGRNYLSSGTYSRAAEYLKSAADRGDIAANYELALLYQNGSGVAKNFNAAFVYMKKAADAGYTKAFCPLGEMYHGGRGVAKDRSMAEAWYRKAADCGDAKARRLLNNM